ncbi:MAG: UDP-N-acetylglucosamine--N-acetylmuramyl-(pentapeptide) pyrophosphoryl-undecaprenol N-acetylglucosamine transferase [Epsilonproteobacteria bacterium]|nr:UDP-N-acetylglucosamine--N-acetylmuramyl-(pentapeptide) pyrophosphoryl-undecaprenol N-acetylglucosamine transferase [Campylobacterota bacterium]
MIAITGGGTGGHLKIAKVVSNELKKRGIEHIYIGSTSGADREWFEKSEIAAYFLDSSGVVNKKGIKKLLSLTNILKQSLNAAKILKQHKIKAVFSVGGYSAAPASFAAIFTNTPLFIHEQNAHIGALNKILKPFSKKFYNTFFYNHPYPVEDIFFQTARIRKTLNTIIFLGGSQGAVAINDLAINSAKELQKKGIKIIHQTGKRDFKRVKEFYEKEGIQADVFDFSKELHQKIASADFALSRSGASTLFELTANLLPALYIPYPYAAGDHQYHNAKWVEDKKGAIVKRKISKDEFLKLIDNIDIFQMSNNLAKIGLKNGVDFIVDDILKELK